MPREYRYGIPAEYNFEAGFLLAVAGGNVPGWGIERKFGSIDAIQSDTPADVWEYGVTAGAETYTFSTGNDIDTISSSNGADTEEFTIIGLTLPNYDEIIQTANLNGQNKVTLTTPLHRVNRMYNSNGTATAGNVYLYEDGDITAGVPDVVTTVRAYVSAGNAQTLQTIYTAPCDNVVFFMGLETALTKGVGATVVSANCLGRTREPNKIFRTRDEFNLISTGTSSKNYNFPIKLPFVSGTDFVPTVDVSANDVGVSWAFSLLIKCPTLNL